MVKNWCKCFLAATVLAGAIGTGLARDVPTPKLKPAQLTPAKTAEVTFPPPGPNSGWPADALKSEKAQCAKRLKGLNIGYKTLAPIGTANACGAAAPLEVVAVAGVTISPPGIFTCDMAEALHGWVTSSVLPAARQHLGKRLTTINNASAYVCRRRNGLASGKLSEHAKANALDIATLGFEDGSAITIKGDWSGLQNLIGGSGKSKFLQQIRRDSCIRFTTVLGPGSDRFHGDHFHIDVARRKNGYRICK